jgi:hypothetical protein
MRLDRKRRSCSPASNDSFITERRWQALHDYIVHLFRCITSRHVHQDQRRNIHEGIGNLYQLNGANIIPQTSTTTLVCMEPIAIATCLIKMDVPARRCVLTVFAVVDVRGLREIYNPLEIPHGGTTTRIKPTSYLCDQHLHAK